MTTYNDFFFRSNMAANGTVPAPAPMYTSPDIICAQTTPIANFQTVLKDNYLTQSYSTNVQVGYDNYFYLRGKNLSSSTVSRQLSMYYAPASIISWPSQWVDNALSTDAGGKTSLITNIAPGAVAVAPDTFLWKPQPISGSDHYCLFSYSTDPANPKPLPGSTTNTVVDMSALLTTNLNIGWRNVTAVVNNPPTWVSEKPLSIPNSQSTPVSTDIYVRCNGLVGGSFAFQASTSDGSDKPIAMPKHDIKVDGQIDGISVVLQPGFHCVISLSFWSNGHTFASGSSLDLAIHFDAGGSTGNSRLINEVAARNLIDADYVRSFQSHPTLNPTLPVFLGMVRHLYV